MASARGFILQASYRVPIREAGRRVPVVHLYGRLEQGGAFLVQDDRQHPHFYIRATDGERARAVCALPQRSVDKRTFEGAPVHRIEVDIPSDVPPLREALGRAGIETFEADVRFAARYLIDRGIQGGCEIEGAAADAGGLAVFENPTLRPADVTVEPRVLSFDIETASREPHEPTGAGSRVRSERLLAISLYAPGVDEVLIVDSTDRPMPQRATRCRTEREALETFCDRIARLDPDVVTGWNVVDFDLAVLESIAARVGHPLHLGREPGAMRLRKAESYFGHGQVFIPGRLVLDGIDLLRGAFVRMDDYSLDAVAREVLGEGKAVAGDVRNRIGEILHNYRHDLAAFALYSRTDARLAYQIVEKLDVVRLAFARSRLTGMTPDRVAASVASFDFLYLSALERMGIVAPSVRDSRAKEQAAGRADAGPRRGSDASDLTPRPVPQHGGHVLAPVAGLHRNVWVFDFKSLYPSLIRTFNIDPLGYVPRPAPQADLIRTPAGAFRREPAILPRLLDELFPRREAAKRRNDDVAAHAIKILMNSFYGVLGTPACRFFNPDLANSITSLGKHMLLWSKSWFESAGYAVLYGDTDSLFVCSNDADPQRSRDRGQALAAALNEDLARHILEGWRVASRLELQFEKLYLALFLPRARHSSRGASKRYAGLVYGPSGDGVEFVGLEVVRRDWTALAKRVQREIYQRLFAGRPVDAYLAEIVGRVRRGELDAELVYHKNLRKAARDYTATTPPHVAAARKSRESARSVRYVMTSAGAEPLDNLRHPLDREHYVGRQVRPVAEPVLEALGLDFERVIGDTRQLDLYSP
jgi:DNA polymerase II